MSRHKQIFMIAGPNGSGKTTSARSILSQQTKIYEFINADEIAKGLAPLHPESADNAIILDNSTIDLQKIIARKNSGEELVVEDKKTWKTIQELSNA